jgi:hypothetical protein
VELTTGYSSLSRIGRLPSLRVGAPALRHLARDGDIWSLVPESTLPQTSIGQLSLPLDSCVVKKGALDEPAPLIDLEHVGRWGVVSGHSEVSEIGSDKLRFGNADLLTTKLRPYLGKTLFNAFEGAIGTTEWIPLRVDPERFRPRLLFHLMQTSRYRDLISLLMTGKEHPRVSPDMIARLRVPLIADVRAQDALVSELDAVDVVARDLEEQVGSPQRVVSLVFERHFGLALDELADERKKTTAYLSLSECAGNRDARFSFKFHCPSGKFVAKRIRSMTSRRLRDFVREPIVLGASVSPNDYAEGTGRLYASMATLKTWTFDADSANEVASAYAESNAAKAFAKDDILMARSGEGTIGKLALIGEGVQGICADFTMRIRVDQSRLMPAFARYCLMSEYFQHLVYVHKKGLGNNTNIFPVQLQDFPMLDLTMPQQAAIVEELDSEIGQLDSKKERIDSVRREMEDRLVAALIQAPA